MRVDSASAAASGELHLMVRLYFPFIFIALIGIEAQAVSF